MQNLYGKETFIPCLAPRDFQNRFYAFRSSRSSNNFDSTVYRAQNGTDTITKWLATKTASYSQDPNNLGDLA